MKPKKGPLPITVDEIHSHIKSHLASAERAAEETAQRWAARASSKHSGKLDSSPIGQLFPRQEAAHSGPYLQRKLHAFIDGCALGVIPREAFSGIPPEPNVVPLPQDDAFIEVMAFSQAYPSNGLIEIAGFVSDRFPGETRIGDFTYRHVYAGLGGAAPTFLGERKTVRIDATPWLSGLVVFGGSGHQQDVSGVSLAIRFDASALSSGDSASNITVVNNAIGVASPPFYRFDLHTQPFTLGLSLEIEPLDFVIVSLILSATLIQRNTAIALVDFEGLAANAENERMGYFREGGLQLFSFRIMDPNCPNFGSPLPPWLWDPVARLPSGDLR